MYKDIEKKRARARKDDKKYREANREKLRAYGRAYINRQGIKEKLKARQSTIEGRNKHNSYQRKYYNSHKEQSKIKGQSRRARLLNADGSHTLGEWENLEAQYNWTCPCCGKREPEVKLTEDHIIPLSRGGSNNIENIQPLCEICNKVKATKIIKF